MLSFSVGMHHYEEINHIINLYLVVDICDVWGIGFIGSFPLSFDNMGILVVVDSFSKGVEALATRTTDHNFSRFRMLAAIILDESKHFKNVQVAALLRKYGVHYKFATSYHPQMSGLMKVPSKRQGES